MLYTNENQENEQKALSCQDFKRLQQNLSNSIEFLIELKNNFAELYANGLEVRKEDMTLHNDNFEEKFNKLQEQIVNLEKKVITSRDYLMSNIKALTEHLACLERKNRGFVDNIKFWKKENNVQDKINENTKKFSQNEPSLFSLNED